MFFIPSPIDNNQQDHLEYSMLRVCYRTGTEQIKFSIFVGGVLMTNLESIESKKMFIFHFIKMKS